jgi:hypothetical protein
MFRVGSSYPRSIVEATPLRSRAWSAALTLAIVLAGRPTRAGGEFLVSLDYQTDPALVGCPSAAEFRKAIVRQIGHDPFRERAPRRMLVRLYLTGPRMGGRVEWRDANDQWEGERTFSSRSESCTEMARAMALATAIQIDLLAAPGQPVPEKPAGDANPPAAKIDAKTATKTAAETGATIADAKPAVVLLVPPKVIERPTETPTEPPTPAPPPREPRIAVDVGAGAIQDFGDAPVFVVPRIAVSVGRPSGIGVRLAVSGLGPGADVTRTEGVAQMDRFFMTLELVRFFRAGRPLQPLLAIGGGWQDVRVKGISADASRDHVGQAVSGLVTASGGLAFVLAARLAVVVEVETLLFWPSVTVEVGSSQAAHLDGAAVFAHGGILARF